MASDYHGVVSDLGADYLAVHGYAGGFHRGVVIGVNRVWPPYPMRRDEPLLSLTPDQALELARHLTASANAIK